MGKGGGGSTTTVQQADPWSGVQPYLKDVYASAETLYGSGSGIAPYTGPQVAELPDWLTGSLMGGINYTQNMMPSLTEAMWGAMYPTLAGAAYSPNQVQAQSIWGPQIGQTPESSWMAVNPGSVTGAQTGWANVQPGAVSGDWALMDALYGGVDNPYLSGMATDLGNRTMQSWDTMAKTIGDQLTGTVLPGIQDDFQAAGSLGASRQALLEGQAIGKAAEAIAQQSGYLNQNLMGQLSNLYGGANEANENRVASLAGQLAGTGSQERLAQASMIQQALMANAGWGQEAALASLNANLQGQLANQAAYGGTSQANQAAALQALLSNQNVGLQSLLANQNNNLSAQQLNQSAGLTANSQNLQALMQQMQAASMIPQLAGFPLSMSNQYLAAYSPILQQQQSLYDLARNQYYEGANAPYDALQRYASIVSPGAGIGGTTTTSQPTYGTNPLASMLPLMAMMYFMS